MKAYYKPCIVCIGGGIESYSIIRQLTTDYHPIIIDQNESSPIVQWAISHPKSATWWNANPYSPISSRQKAQKEIMWGNKNGHSYHIVGVLCTATDTPDTQAALAKYFKVPSIGKDAAELGKDKWEQVKVLAEAGIPVPNTRMVDARLYTSDMRPPVDIPAGVFKPRVGRGARGVLRFTNQEEKELAFKMSVFEDWVSPKNNSFLMQEWIDGPQLSTESVIYNGNVIFTAVALRNYDHLDKYSPYIIENGSDCPYHLSVDLKAKLDSTIRDSARALDWDNCTIKGDFVLKDGEFYAIELAPRLSGGMFCSRIIPVAYGYDFVDAAVRLSVGKKPHPYEGGQTKAVCQRFVFPKDEWIGKVLTQVPEMGVSKNIIVQTGTSTTTLLLSEKYSDFTSYKSVGDKILPVINHGCRLAQFISVSNSSVNAKDRAEAIIAGLESEYNVE